MASHQTKQTECQETYRHSQQLAKTHDNKKEQKNPKVVNSKEKNAS